MFTQSPRSHTFGFTLVELLVALAILAIIAALAVPVYTQYTRRAMRTGAQGDLGRCALGLAQCDSRQFTYVNCLDTDNDGVGDANTGNVTPNICRPTSNNYTITVEGPPTQSTFILRAVPNAGTAVAGTGNLEIDAMGNNRYDINADGDFDDPDEDSWPY